MTSHIIAEGRSQHKHYDPDHMGIYAHSHGWNTVVRSTCGHYYVRRYTYIAMLFPLCDHFPIWKRLRPWHLDALLRVLLRKAKQ